MELLVKNKKIDDITETGITFSSNMKYDEWEAIGRDLQRVGRCWQWWVGDWLNFGEAHYGEKYAQAIEETGVTLSTLQSCAYVAGSVETCRRRQVVPWSHHSEIAKFNPQEQEKWLKKVEKEGLSVSELRAAIKENKQPKIEEEPDAEEEIDPDDVEPADEPEDLEEYEDVPEEPEPADWKTLRAKAIKTADALQRAIDDLFEVRASGNPTRHTTAIDRTQQVLGLLKDWK